MFVINVCFQTQLCRLIRLCLYQFSKCKCTANLLVWTGFQSCVLSHVAYSHNISLCHGYNTAVQGYSALIWLPFSCLLHTQSWSTFFWRGRTITVLKAQSSIQVYFCHCEQILLSFRLCNLFFTFIHYLAYRFCVIYNCFNVLLYS